MLKEEDILIDHVRSMVREEVACNSLPQGAALEAAIGVLQRLLDEHHKNGDASELKRVLPALGRIFTRLDVVGALKEYDAGSGICARRFVPPTFRELREVINLATVNGMAPHLRLVTLDADDTIYGDGRDLPSDSPVISLIIKLMRLGVHVALVTAASYPGEPHRMETRISALLRAMAFAVEAGASPRLVDRFRVMSGECNYLLVTEVTTEADGLSPAVHLRELEQEVWKNGRGVRWSGRTVHELLDAAEAALKRAAAAMALDVLVIRKPRAVGIVPRPVQSGFSSFRAYVSGSGHRISYEVFEEVALSVQHDLASLKERFGGIPYTVFNGGHDCFIDIGDKSLGIRAVQALVGASPKGTVHAGDRFTRTGNDLRARDVASSLWVTSPNETEFLLAVLVENVRKHRAAAGLPAIAPLTEVVTPVRAVAAAAAAEAGSEAHRAHLLHVPPVQRAPSPFTPPGTLAEPAHGAAFRFDERAAASAARERVTGVEAVSDESPAVPVPGAGGGAARYVGTTVITPALGAMDAGAQAALLEGLSLGDGVETEAALPPQLLLDALALAPAGGSAEAPASGRGAASTPLAVTAGAWPGGISSSPRAGGVYGLTSARALQDLQRRTAADVRSQWAAAGGTVVGEVRPATPNGPGSTGVGSKRSTGALSQ